MGATDKPISERLFNAMLWLLPQEFRERFSAEMQSVFRDQRQDAQAGGRAARVRFWWDTASGLMVTAAREHRDILVQDAEYALRMMRKDLGFTMVAVVILGLAIGAGTAAFSAANTILIQPLPFAGGNRLVQLQQMQPAVGVDRLKFSVKEIEDYRSRNHTLDSVVEYHSMFFSLLGGREPERVDTAVVSANFFRVLGVIPLYGRTFMDEDDRPNARPVLILSYEFWQRSFGGDPNIVGRSYSMNDKQHVVVGILPPIPQFPEVVDVYMPTAACPTRSGLRFIADRSSRMMSVFATLKPGVSLREAQNDVRGIAAQLRSSYPDAYPDSKGYDIRVTPVHERMTSDIRPVLIALAAAALLLLVLACSNVAGLMLSRLLARSKELTVRAALGASRARIVRSFVTEGMMLALAAAAVGLLLAFWSIDILVPFSARFTTLASQLRMGPDVIAFGLLLALLCGFAIAFVPAIGLRQAGFSMSQLDGVHIPARMSSRTRAILVAAQLAVSVVLLVGAGLTLRTLLRLEHIDAGFDSTGVTTARIYETKDTYRTFYQSLLERSRHLDGVEAVALSSTFPLSSRGDESEYVAETLGHPHGNAAKVGTVSARAATPGYFKLMGVPLLLGRDFNAEDDEQHPLVTIVNQQLAQHYWPGENPIGKKLRFNAEQERTVVGVIGDVRHRGLDKAPVDEAYCAFTQSRAYFMDLVVRGSRAPRAIAPELSWIAHDLDPDVVIADVQALSEVRENSLGPRRNTALFFSVFAVVALAITATGISGLMALEVTERRHEIGVRLALGATPQRVIRSMMRRVIVIIAAGLGCGFLAAWTISAPMSNLIYGILPRDSVTFSGSSALLVLIGLVSSWLPLTRIARLDPTVLLKAE
jgi:putative ABC transport system permease protein